MRLDPRERVASPTSTSIGRRERRPISWRWPRGDTSPCLRVQGRATSSRCPTVRRHPAPPHTPGVEFLGRRPPTPSRAGAHWHGTRSADSNKQIVVCGIRRDHDHEASRRRPSLRLPLPPGDAGLLRQVEGGGLSPPLETQRLVAQTDHLTRSSTTTSTPISSPNPLCRTPCGLRGSATPATTSATLWTSPSVTSGQARGSAGWSIAGRVRLDRQAGMTLRSRTR